MENMENVTAALNALGVKTCDSGATPVPQDPLQLPPELVSQITEFVGFNHRPALSMVCASWYGHAALVAARATHRATVASGGTGNEYFALSLRSSDDGARVVDDHDRTVGGVFLEERRPPASETPWADRFDEAMRYLRTRPSPQRRSSQLPCSLILRTDSQRGLSPAYVVEIDRYRGLVFVYKHPPKKPWDYRSNDPPNPPLESIVLKDLVLRAHYAAAGVFIGVTRLHLERGPRGFDVWRSFGFGDCILLQLAVTTEDGRQVYNYAYIAGSLYEFSTHEPIVRFFAHVGNNHAQYPIALTATDMIFFAAYGPPVRASRSHMLGQARCVTGCPTNAELVERYGEEGHELISLRTGGGPMWGVTGGVHLMEPWASDPRFAEFARQFPTVHQTPWVATLTPARRREFFRQVREHYAQIGR